MNEICNNLLSKKATLEIVLIKITQLIPNVVANHNYFLNIIIQAAIKTKPCEILVRGLL